MKGTEAAQPHPKPGWLQPHHAHARRDPSRGSCLPGRPKPNLALVPSRHHRSMTSKPSAAFLHVRDSSALLADEPELAAPDVAGGAQSEGPTPV